MTKPKGGIRLKIRLFKLRALWTEASSFRYAPTVAQRRSQSLIGRTRTVSRRHGTELPMPHGKTQARSPCCELSGQCRLTQRAAGSASIDEGDESWQRRTHRQANLRQKRWSRAKDGFEAAFTATSHRPSVPLSSWPRFLPGCWRELGGNTATPSRRCLGLGSCSAGRWHSRRFRPAALRPSAG